MVPGWNLVQILKKPGDYGRLYPLFPEYKPTISKGVPFPEGHLTGYGPGNRKEATDAKGHIDDT
jgi:hypothetical protein